MPTEFAYMPDRRNELIPVEKWVRVYFRGQPIADSRRRLLLRSSQRTPVYYFPQADVRMDILIRSDHKAHSPALGEASYWTIQAGGRTAENAAWQCAEASGDLSQIKGHIAFEWDRMDA